MWRTCQDRSLGAGGTEQEDRAKSGCPGGTAQPFSSSCFRCPEATHPRLPGEASLKDHSSPQKSILVLFYVNCIS